MDDRGGKMVTTRELELVEFDRLSLRDWKQLVQREAEPFGATTERLRWRSKDRHVGLRDETGALLAAGGFTVVTVAVEGHDPFAVVGLGALIVRRDQRSAGLGRIVIRRLTEMLPEVGPDRAMIFCEPHLTGLYSSIGYRPVPGPVRVAQPDGEVEMPLPAMWRPIRPGDWPDGVVRIDGLPF